MRMTSLISITIFLFLMVPQTVMAMDIHQQMEIEIMPKSVGNYTKLFNMVDENNSWLDNRHIWEGFRTDGRIIGEGAIPNPVQINDYENDSGTAKISIISVKYLDTYEIMSGTSESYIRLPLAVNQSSYSTSIKMRIKLYAIEGNTYNITDFNYTNVEYSTYASHYLLYFNEATLSDFDDISNQSYTYPANITNLSLQLFYLHLRGPIIAKSTYILLQYLEIPSAKKNPIYLLASYQNNTGYYYSSGEIKEGAYPSWSMLCKYGMSEEVYSMSIPGNKTYFYNKPVGLSVHKGDTVYVSFVMPVYTSVDTQVKFQLFIVPTDYINPVNMTYDYWIGYVSIQKGMNHVYINYSFSADRDATIEYLRVGLKCADGDNVYIYLARDPYGNIYKYTTNFEDSPIYYFASQMLFFSMVSTTQHITFQEFHFAGIQEPIIKYNVKYVYSLLDFPILIYKAGMYVLTNAIYFLTFGKVDLRHLYTDEFILQMAQNVRAFLDWIANGPIGLFIKMTIDFVVNAAQWWGYWLLQAGLFLLGVAAMAIFLFPWILLWRGFLVAQVRGIDAMLDLYASYADRITSLMNRFVTKGVKK